MQNVCTEAINHAKEVVLHNNTCYNFFACEAIDLDGVSPIVPSDGPQ